MPSLPSSTSISWHGSSPAGGGIWNRTIGDKLLMRHQRSIMTNELGRAEDQVMHLPWTAQQYERTCADCGYSWRVPRQLARKRVVSIYGATSGIRGRASGQAAEADLQAGMAIVEQAESLRTCPKCSSEHYSQHPVRS